MLSIMLIKTRPMIWTCISAWIWFPLITEKVMMCLRSRKVWSDFERAWQRETQGCRTADCDNQSWASQPDNQPFSQNVWLSQPSRHEPAKRHDLEWIRENCRDGFRERPEKKCFTSVEVPTNSRTPRQGACTHLSCYWCMNNEASQIMIGLARTWCFAKCCKPSTLQWKL